MPTSEKPKPRQPEPELFYWDRRGKKRGGLRADEALHDSILDNGDHAAGEAVSRKVAKRLGLSDAAINRLMGK